MPQVRHGARAASVTVEEAENWELVDMWSRSWVSGTLPMPVLLLAMGIIRPGSDGRPADRWPMVR